MEHTNGWPQPVTLCSLGNDFNTSILDGLLSLGSQTCGANRRDNGASGRVGTDTARLVVGRSAGTVAACLGDVERVAVNELVRGNARRFGGQGRDNVKALGVNITVLGVVGCPVKLAVTITASLEKHLVSVKKPRYHRDVLLEFRDPSSRGQSSQSDPP